MWCGAVLRHFLIWYNMIRTYRSLLALMVMIMGADMNMKMNRAAGSQSRQSSSAQRPAVPAAICGIKILETKLFDFLREFSSNMFLAGVWSWSFIWNYPRTTSTAAFQDYCKCIHRLCNKINTPPNCHLLAHGACKAVKIKLESFVHLVCVS